MDYRYLKAFLLTAEYSSFSKAAKKLAIAQSAVSRQIKLLEESLGTELIIRSSKKVILTEKGQQLFFTTKNFTHDISDIFEKEEKKNINVGILHGLLENWFTKVLQKYYEEHDNNISVFIDKPDSLKEAMLNGKYDIIITTENIQNELISSLKIFEEKLVLISKDEINISKIQNERWIIYHASDYLLKAFKKHSKNILSVDSITAMVTLVKKGIGIAMVPDHLLSDNDELQQYDLKKIKNTEIHLATLNYKSLPGHLKTLIKFMRENI